MPDEENKVHQPPKADALAPQDVQRAVSLPLTEEEFFAKLDDLIAAGQRAGFRHVPFMVAKHVARKGLGFFEALIDAADQGYSKNKDDKR